MDMLPRGPLRCAPDDRRSLLGEGVPALIFCDNSMGRCQQAKYGRSSFNTQEVRVGMPLAENSHGCLQSTLILPCSPPLHYPDHPS